MTPNICWGYNGLLRRIPRQVFRLPLQFRMIVQCFLGIGSLGLRQLSLSDAN